MPTPREIRESIRAHGRAVGFDKVGFAPARLDAERPRLEEWLARGYHGEMAWMAREPARRTDAERVLPGARTVVCCALGYYQGPPPPPDPSRGVVASYARGGDYHRVLGERLERFARIIHRLTGARYRVYTDTGPVLEKAYAVAAGLGWLGKHSNLLARRGSSWFLLGEILLCLELPPDEPSPSHCGTCRRCIDACPTRAIVAPYVVDSRLCISYLTIELRGPIPRHLRPLVGSRIFGCDDCQDVCPWNRFAVPSAEAAWAARPGLAAPRLTSLLELDRAGYLELTRGTAVRRAGYAGLLRNVAVALGNARDPAAAPALRRALGHTEPLVRGHVAWALGRLGDREALVERRRTEPDAYVREEIDAALEELDDEAALPAPG